MGPASLSYREGGLYLDICVGVPQFPIAALLLTGLDCLLSQGRFEQPVRSWTQYRPNLEEDCTSFCRTKQLCRFFDNRTDSKVPTVHRHFFQPLTKDGRVQCGDPKVRWTTKSCKKTGIKCSTAH